jgi:hypothetical protein
MGNGHQSNRLFTFRIENNKGKAADQHKTEFGSAVTGTGLRIFLNSPNRILDRGPKFRAQAAFALFIPSGG